MRIFKIIHSSAILSPSNKKILKDFVGSILRVLFLRESRILFYKYLKYEILPSFFYPPSSSLRRDKAAIWKQIVYNKNFRSPKAITYFYRDVLRVCITYRCNLSCRYCYAEGMKNSIPEDMTIKDFCKVIVWAKYNGYSHIRFMGGEPTIHPSFTEILDICCDNKMNVSLSTNNTFSSQIGARFDKFFTSAITINYVLNRLDDKQQSSFRDNLGQLNAKGIRYGFSYVIGCEDDGWMAIFEDAKLYKPAYIRVSVAIPGLSKQTSISELTSNFKLISKRLFEFQDKCRKINAPFYIYRPLMPCMFSAQDYRRLTKDSPFICYTRCPLGARGDYAAPLAVNPDLSIFPCLSVFLKGPNILSFKNKEEISIFYKQNIKKMLTEPLMKSCLTCDKRDNFLDNLDRGEKSDLKSCYKQSLCQGGCLGFKESAQSLCYVE